MMVLNRSRALLALALGVAPAAGRAQEEPVIPAARLVEVRLDDLGEEGLAPVAPLAPPQPSYWDSLEILRRIGSDPEVDGIRLYVNGGLDLPRAREVLRELRQMAAEGKTIACYCESLDRNTLLLASVARPFVMPPSGEVLLQGPVAEVLYLKELLAKLGVRFEVLHVGEFKTAFEDFARDSMSPEQRETIQAILDEYWREAVDTIALQRGVDAARVEELFGRWILSPEMLKEAGLLDAVAYEDEFEAQLRERFGGPVTLVEDYGQEGFEDLEALMANPLKLFAALPKLLEPAPETLPPGPRIAIVYATGMILPGKSQSGLGGAVMGSDTIVEALEQALEDDDVQAIVFRVNSPGGSALASDMIWRAIQRVKQTKPVIASMGDVAGSGGYWISMGCSQILAQPTTITGSIGVVSALPDLTALFQKIGVRVEVVGAGPRTEELAALRGPSPFLKETLSRWMEEVYQQFLQKVAQGRGMEPAVVDRYGRGRAWTGRTAKELGLVDHLGGLRDAVALACAMAGLDPSTTPVRQLPEAPDLFEQLEEMFGGFLGVGSGWHELARSLELLGADGLVPALELVARHVTQERGELAWCLMPWTVRIR